MTETILNERHLLRVAMRLFREVHPKSDWQHAPTPSQDKRQERFKRLAREVINMTVQEYERMKESQT